MPGRSAWERANAAKTPADALRWLERAHRLLPDDDLVTITLGAHRLRCHDPVGAIDLLAPHAPKAQPAAIALAAAHLAMNDPANAAAALATAIRTGPITPDIAALADRLAHPWCGHDGDANLRTSEPPTTTEERDGHLHVEGPNGPFLGSPLPIARLCATHGFVEWNDGLAGWAWSPARTGPLELQATGPRGTRKLRAETPADAVQGLPPFAQPRRFTIPAADCAPLGTPIAVTDPTGRPLLGSPLWPGCTLEPPTRPIPRPAPRPRPPARPIHIVIPIYGATPDALACIRTVLATTPPETTIHIVDDASPDPALPAALAAVTDPRIRLHRHAANRGFPAAANTGLRAASGHDVVLLNSDTLVFADWLPRLRAAAYAAPDIATATPLTADGSITTLATDAPPEALDEAARTTNPGLVVELPVGVGFCLFLRRDALDAAGDLREDLFAQGYGEETEFCLRAARLGWRHVAATDVFVAHRGGTSFGPGRAALRARNQAIIDAAYPGFSPAVAAFEAADPLREARRDIAAHLWATTRRPTATIFITHAGGGGTTEFVTARADALTRAGARPIVLRPDPAGCRIQGWPDLRFRTDELPDLADLLRDDNPTHVECHHLLGHDHAILGLATRLGLPVDTWVHDASLFCPRIALLGPDRRYCGEPDLAGCTACIEAAGTNLEEPISPTALVARSTQDLMNSRQILVPTPDWHHRLRRHFPTITPTLHPWEPPPTSTPNSHPRPLLLPLPPAGEGRGEGLGGEGLNGEGRTGECPTTIAIIGAIGPEKGYDILLACAADARARRLPLRFVVCGETEDDERLMAAGPIFVTGRYAPDEANALIRAQRADLAFLPSIWPETWCFALTRAWQAGLPAIAFDLGAQADRIRATGNGHLLPLGLPPDRINDALCRLASAPPRLQPSRASPPDSNPCPTPPAP